MNPKSQKQRVLAMLRWHGRYGVRSDRFLEVGIPRAAARILELREEGHEISAEREKQFSRYRLVNSAGLDTDNREGSQPVNASPQGNGSLDRPGEQLTANGARSSLGVHSGGDSGGKSRARQTRGIPDSRLPEPAPTLFDPAEARERPLNAFTDSEAA